MDVIMGTFSKSLASLGGFMAGKERVVDYVRHSPGPLFFRLHSPLQLRRGAGGPSAAQEAAGAGGAVDAAVGLRPQRADGTGPEPPPLHHAHHSIYTYDSVRTLVKAKELYDAGFMSTLCCRLPRRSGSVCCEPATWPVIPNPFWTRQWTAWQLLWERECP